jgi:NAD(P)-dependent dehydrogenase (short-subunit alcohol dehydrogenase family)
MTEMDQANREREAIDLSGRVALVTGAAKRTGRALALALAKAGADVAVHYQSSHDEAASLVSEIEANGRRAVLVRADLTDPDATKVAFRSATETFGRLDILINNVGSIVWKKFHDLDDGDWNACLGGTLFATLNASQAALPALRESGRGRIINILDADADSTGPVPFATAYKIGKRATFSLTKTMAVTEAPHQVTVNAVSPGTLKDSPTKPALDLIPAGRYGTYDDVTHAACFLASDAAAYVTGTQMKVSGGYLI